MSYRQMNTGSANSLDDAAATFQQCAQQSGLVHSIEETVGKTIESPHFFQRLINFALAVMLAFLAVHTHLSRVSVGWVITFLYLTWLFYQVINDITLTTLVNTMQSYAFSNLLAILLVYPVSEKLTYTVLASMAILSVLLYTMFNTLTGDNLVGSLPFATWPNPPHLGLDGVSLQNKCAGSTV